MSTQDLPSRTEFHIVDTLTLSDRQFLRGEADGAPTHIVGALTLAQRLTPQPVVVLIHGSGGVGPGIQLWARQINAAGYAAFLLDGFTGRGLLSVAADQAKLGRLAFTLDYYRALEVLAKHPAVDASRIAVLGFSRGGQGALYSAMTRFHKLWNRSGVTPCATLAVYPDCATRYLEDEAMTGAPIRVFHGTADDMNPLAPAAAYVERLKAAGCDVALTEYPGGHHGFDNPMGSAAWTDQPQSVRDCTIEEREPGLLVNAATEAPFTYQDPCVARGSHAGRDPVMGPQVREDVLAYLKALFG